MAEKATVSIGLDLTTLKKSLADALAQINKLGNAKPSVKVSVDDSDIDGADKKIDGLSRTETVKIDVDTKNAEASAGGFSKKLGGLGALAGGALGGAAAQALGGIASGLKEGALAADDFGDSLEVAFSAQGIQDIDGEIEKVSKSTLDLANNLGLPVSRTRELAVSVSSLGGFTGQSAQDLTKLAAGLETFTNGAVKGEAVAKAFARGVNDPEGAAAIENLSKKYPQLAKVLKSNIDPAEKLRLANEQLGTSFETVAKQQEDAGGILNKIQNQLGEVFEKVGTQLLDALAPIAESLIPIIESLLPILESVLTPLTPILQSVGTAIVGIVQQIAPLFQQLTPIISQFGSIFITALNTLLPPLTNLVTVALTPILGLFAQLAPIIAQIAQQIMPPLATVIGIVANAIVELMPALKPVLDIFLQLLPVIGGLVARLLNALVPVIGTVVKIAVNLLKTLLENKAVMAAVQGVVLLLGGALNILVSIFEGVAFAANFVANIFNFVIEKVGALVNAIASFDLGKIKDALLGLGDTNASAAVEKTTKATRSLGDVVKDLAGNTKELNTTQTENKKLPPPGGGAPAANDTAQLAKEIKNAKNALSDLNDEQRKQQEIRAADTIADAADREKKKIEIEQRFGIIALENEKKRLESLGQLRSEQEALINKKIEILKEQNNDKLRQIENKAAEERAKAAEAQQQRLEDITLKFAERRVAKLQERLAAGDASVSNELISAQRSLIDAQLNSTIDSIVEKAPEYEAGAKILGEKLARGVINPEQFKKETDALRQNVLQQLQGLPTDTTNAAARELQLAYANATDQIIKGTSDVVKAANDLAKQDKVTSFADSLLGIGEALRSIDIGAIYGEAAEKAADLNKEQEQLIQNLQDGTASYQDSVDQLASLQTQQEETASATATAIAAAFQAIADQQAQAAQDGINAINEGLQRRKEIADEEIQLEKDKADEIKRLQAQKIQDEELYQKSLDAIDTKYKDRKKALDKESEKIAKDSADVQSNALNQIAVSAGAAFASLIAGGESAGEALKKVVGSTVSALLDLYTPSIVALFSSVIPPPFGAIAGFAAVQALKVLLQSALSGFEEGGYTGNAGTKQVAGVVHGQEFVMTAETTRKNRALLEHLHSGKSLESFPALQKMLADNQISTIPVTELQLMRSELSAIRQRLDSMPNGIQGNMGVDVQVGMDTYLYERDRSRMIARKLRG
jgi:hypothetical protein